MSVCYAPCPVVFDLDGTLIDSAPDIHAAVNAVLREHNVAPLTLDQVRSFIGAGVQVLWQRIAQVRRLPAPDLRDYIAGFMARYSQPTSLTRLYPGVRAVLDALANRGHPLGICTNKPLQPALSALEYLEINGLFQIVIGGDCLPLRKPDPAPLSKALQDLGAAPDAPQAIFVGDSEIDAATAAALPVPFMLFTCGYRKTPVADLPHHAAFDHFDQLPGLIAQAVMA